MAKEEAPKPNVAETFMKAHKDDHYNFIPPAAPYLVSSGSLNFDYYLEGGFGAGIHRFCGMTEGGKTSAALTVLDNMVNTVEKSKALYIKAEGRLSDKMKARYRMKFVTDPAKWDVGTCLVVESNIFEFVFDLLRALLRDNPEGFRYGILIDSMDGLLRRDDAAKGTDEANKVAGGALLTSDFLRRVSLGMSKFGHLCILTSQVRATIRGQYEKADPNGKTNGSGGNALAHYPDWVIQFERRYKSNAIVDDNGKLVGHNCEILICKSTNETTDNKVSYPIRYKQTAGKSVWREREVVEMLLMFELLSKKGSWLSFDDSIVAEAKEKGIEITPKFQGMDKAYQMMDESPELCAFLCDKVQSLLD